MRGGEDLGVRLEHAFQRRDPFGLPGLIAFHFSEEFQELLAHERGVEKKSAEWIVHFVRDASGHRPEGDQARRGLELALLRLLLRDVLEDHDRTEQLIAIDHGRGAIADDEDTTRRCERGLFQKHRYAPLQCALQWRLHRPFP